MMNIIFLSALENEHKNKLLKENLNIEKAVTFLSASIFGVLSLIKFLNNTSYSYYVWEVLVRQKMS